MITTENLFRAGQLPGMKNLLKASMISCSLLLAACGSGSKEEVVDLGEPVDPVNIPTGTFNFPVNELLYNFDELIQMQYWKTTVDAGAPSPSFLWVSGEGARQGTDYGNDQGGMVINPGWGSELDQFSVSADFSQDVIGLASTEIDSVDLSCADIKLFLYVPQAYVADGNMGVKFFTRDQEGRYGSLGWRSVADMTGDQYNLIDLPDIAPDSYDYVDEGYDLTKVEIVGVQFIANGKLATVTGDLKLDNISIVPAAIKDCFGGFEVIEVFSAEFDAEEDLDAWGQDFINGDATYTVTHNATDGNPGGAAEFAINWANGSEDEIAHITTFAESIDLTGKTIRVDVYIPAAYVTDGRLGMKVYTKDSDFRYGGLGFISVGGMVPDAWNTIEINNIQDSIPPFDFRADGYDITDVNALGLQFISNGKPISVTGNILVDNFKVLETVESEGPGGTVAVSFDFEEAEQVDVWENDYNEGGLDSNNPTMTISNELGSGSLAFGFTWTSSADKALRITFLPEPISLANAVIRFDIYVPQAYVTDGLMGFKFYTKDSAFTYASYGWNSVGELVGDAWNSFEIAVGADGSGVIDYPADPADSNINEIGSFGFEFVANGKSASVGGTIHIDNVEIIIPDETSEP